LPINLFYLCGFVYTVGTIGRTYELRLLSSRHPLGLLARACFYAGLVITPGFFSNSRRRVPSLRRVTPARRACSIFLIFFSSRWADFSPPRVGAPFFSTKGAHEGLLLVDQLFSAVSLVPFLVFPPLLDLLYGYCDRVDPFWTTQGYLIFLLPHSVFFSILVVSRFFIFVPYSTAFQRYGQSPEFNEKPFASWRDLFFSALTGLIFPVVTQGSPQLERRLPPFRRDPLSVSCPLRVGLTSAPCAFPYDFFLNLHLCAPPMREHSSSPERGLSTCVENGPASASLVCFVRVRILPCSTPPSLVVPVLSSRLNSFMYGPDLGPFFLAFFPGRFLRHFDYRSFFLNFHSLSPSTPFVIIPKSRSFSSFFVLGLDLSSFSLRVPFRCFDPPCPMPLRRFFVPFGHYHRLSYGPFAPSPLSHLPDGGRSWKELRGLRCNKENGPGMYAVGFSLLLFTLSGTPHWVSIHFEFLPGWYSPPLMLPVPSLNGTALISGATYEGPSPRSGDSPQEPPFPLFTIPPSGRSNRCPPFFSQPPSAAEAPSASLFLAFSGPMF